jgi:hypothetical protein
MAWPVIAAAAATLGGSYLAGKSAEKAANTGANAQLQAGREATSASAFRPIGLTTRFGSSNFTMGTDQYGNPIVTEAGYTPSAEITDLQNRLSALYKDSFGQAEQAQALGAPMGVAGQGLFNLGQQYLAQSPEQARQQYIAEQQNLLRAPRMEEEQRLAASVFGRGRSGLNVGAAGQPELAALANARRQQDLALAAQAEQAAQQRLGFGAGLFSTGGALIGNQYALQNQALAPFLTQFGAQQGLEQAALQPLEIGANLGGRNVNTAGANALLQSGLGAANTRLQGSLVGPSLTANALSKVNYENLFNKLMAPRTSPGLYGGTSGSGFAYNPDIDTDGGYYGSSSGFENMSGGYSPY